jgi:glutamine synthetase
MTEERGKLTLEALEKLVRGDQVDTVLVVFTDLYGRLMGKRLDARFFLESAARHGTHACDYLLTVDMEMEPVPGYRFANWELGYGDVHLVPDLGTLRSASWLPRTALVLCDVLGDKTGRPVPQAPRSMLARQVERLSGMGYSARAASELEYYIFAGSYRQTAEKGHRDLEPAGWYLEDYNTLQGTREEGLNGAIRRHLASSGVPVESTKGEWGLGQHEINIRHAGVLDMADRHGILKHCVKEIADGLGLSVTFMAKYAADQAGSSCHVHLSLWKGKKSAFPGKLKLGPIECSDVFGWFLGGWMERLPELMVLYAPTVNSYKRYQAASWAPTRIAWSHDNRTAGFRVVGKGDSLRIECRVPGADCNPYLVYAAALASGIDGIERKTRPPDIFEGDIYSAKELPRVPETLEKACDLFEASAFARAAFGEDVVEHYARFFRTEDAAYRKAVTDWERRRYFERI